MGIRLLPYMLIGMVITGVLVYWNNLVDRIDQQELVITAKSTKITQQQQAMEALVASAKVREEQYKKDKEQAIKEAKAEVIKANIEKGLKYDKSKSVDINSTMYHIP